MSEPEIRDEDELEELPPLDGDSRDKSEVDSDFGDLLEEAEDDATLDDETAESDPPDAADLELDPVEDGWLGEAGEAGDVDVRDVAMVDFGEDLTKAEAAQDQDEEPGVGDEEFDLDDAPEHGGLDLGDEGPLDADEELRESDLPDLDADDEGEFEEPALLDGTIASALEEPLGLAWAAEPWLRVGAPVTLVGSTALACAGRGAIVVGRSEAGTAELVRVDLEGTCERLAAEGLAADQVRALAVEGHLVAAVLRGGRLLVSSDDGANFVPVVGSAEGVSAGAAVFASSRLWARTRTGGLVVYDTSTKLEGASSTLPGVHHLDRYPVPGVAAALTCDAANGTRTAAILVVDAAGRPTALLRVEGGVCIRREMVDMPESGSTALVAIRGENVAYSARHGGLVRSMSGAAWKRFEWEGQITALAFVDDRGTLVASMYSVVDDTSTLVRLDSAGAAAIVARVGAVQGDPETDGCIVAMADDEARGVLWIAGGFGVAAFAIR